MVVVVDVGWVKVVPLPAQDDEDELVDTTNVKNSTHPRRRYGRCISREAHVKKIRGKSEQTNKIFITPTTNLFSLDQYRSLVRGGQ